MTLDPDRRAALLGAKLGALVRDHWGDAGRRPAAFGGGAALVADDTVWLLADQQPTRVLGPALAWVDAQAPGGADVHVLVDDVAASGVVARRAELFEPAPTVWRVEGRALQAAAPAPFPEPRPITADADELVGMLQTAGVEVLVEHGELVGEVLGLEIARVVVAEDGAARLEVGVGRHDREAFAMIHGGLPTADALAAVVDAVLSQRRADASPHPLNRLAAERWMRSLVVAEPGIVGARALAPADPTVPRDNLKEAAPAVAVGQDASGETVVVVCSSGIDLDLVPAAADARRWHAPSARLVLLVAERDAHPATRALAATLRRPAEIVTLAADWRHGLTSPS